MNQLDANEVAEISVRLTPEVTYVLKRAASEAGRTLEEYALMILAIHASGERKLQQMMDNFDESFREYKKGGDNIV